MSMNYKDIFTNLLASATIIHASLEIHAYLTRVAIANANISARGSIRQSQDLRTWAGKLITWTEKGVDARTVIRDFNAQASQRAAVTGFRQTSLLALLRPGCHDAVHAMVELLGTVGPAQVFWEEQAWSNKRSVPGYVARSGVKIWQEILRVTPAPSTFFVKGLCQSQLEKLPHNRRRLSKVQMEEHAKLASMVCWLSSACLGDMPAMAKAVDGMQKSFLQGHHTLLLDLQGLLHEENPRSPGRIAQCCTMRRKHTLRHPWWK